MPNRVLILVPDLIRDPLHWRREGVLEKKGRIRQSIVTLCTLVGEVLGRGHRSISLEIFRRPSVERIVLYLPFGKL